jgi:hypothetical protein
MTSLCEIAEGVSEVQLDFKQMSEECEMVFQQTGIDPKLERQGGGRCFSILPGPHQKLNSEGCPAHTPNA